MSNSFVIVGIGCQDLGNTCVCMVGCPAKISCHGVLIVFVLTNLSMDLQLRVCEPNGVIFSTTGAYCCRFEHVFYLVRFVVCFTSEGPEKLKFQLQKQQVKLKYVDKMV